MSETTERHEFSAEVGRLLDLVVRALYSDREIFLRELVANAADAVDRRRFEALTDPALALPPDARVRIAVDKAARTILIEDSGIGMSREELGANLGTIARSDTRAFGQAVADAKPEDRVSLIGQFGVGFYSAFMVADRVEVTSRRAGADEAWTWASDGGGDELILFTCTGAPAHAFYDALGPWSARIGSAFEHDGRVYRSTAKVQANLFGVDSCSTANGADPRCVLTFNAGDFLDQ